ncbi:connector enhancer of kinase suppressor of ras 1 isoform X19 [Macaca mulatta]
MEPVETWTPGKVATWLRGLDDSLQDYPFEDWQLPGKNLLQLCPRSLEALAVRCLGHQELILGGVEQLQALSSRLQTENLKSLTEGLLGATRDFQSIVQGRLGDCAKTPIDVLCATVELVHEANTLLFWLSRYLFSHLNDFSACQEIRDLLEELSQVLHEDGPADEKEGTVLRIELLEQRAVLEQVQLDSPLDLEIHTTSNCQHFVSQVDTQVPTDSQLQIQPGDEVVQINEQVVVGWPHKNMVRELLREPAGLSLVLKKIPIPETPPQTPPQVLDSPHRRSPSLSLAPLSPRAPSEDVFAFDLSSNPSPGPSPAWTDSASLGPEPLPIPLETPAILPAGVAGTPGLPESPDKSPVGRKKSKGLATRLSRRRVSCRQLGRPDCDGWLLLRKAPGGFMGPRWRRCWFVLKGHTLYWYRQPQDEKAEGLINVSNYSLESGHDQKKKYVFQLTHDVYKPFIFAADTLTDLSMWVRHLITCISKYQSPGRVPPPREEDCYSETEAEDPDDEAGSHSASPSPAQAGSPLHGDTSPAATPTQRSPRTSFGSLTGRPQPLTQEQWRSSFMRRNRDPQLNERVHRVRALQSTLKAKLQELQVLEEVLGDPELTGEKFRQWKEQNQELYSEGLGAWGVAQAEGSSHILASDSREHTPNSLSSDPEEHSHLCPLTSESNLQPPDL